MEIATCALKGYKTAAPVLGNLSYSVPRQCSGGSSRSTGDRPSSRMAFGTSTAASTPNVPQRRPTSSILQLPLYKKAEDFRERVAVCDANGSFLYDDIVRRSADLAAGIRDLLQPNRSKQHKIGFLVPNGAGFVITQWACWMSGNIAVPLSKDDSQDALEFCINDAQCDLVIAAKSSVDRVNDICKRSNRKIVCLDDTWTANPRKEVDTAPLASVTEAQTAENGALILYNSVSAIGNRRKVDFSHAQLNVQMDSIATGWDLTEKCSVLHALPLTNLYGIVTALLAPLSVGGKVVMLPQFDTLKVWSHLLGIGFHNPLPLPKVNLFLSVPSQYHKLLDRHKQLFRDRKTQDYVKINCKKRVRAMTSTYDPLPKTMREEWSDATGHGIINCYTSIHGGTVLSGRMDGNGKALDKSQGGMETLPAVQAGVARFPDGRGRSSEGFLDHKGVGELFIRGAGVGTLQPGMKPWRGDWLSTGDSAKIVDGKIELL